MAKREIIHIENLHKMYGNKEIFHEANASILENNIYGVIGANGAGKSTLFKIILGKEEQDDGVINLANFAKIGFIPQEDPFIEGDSVLDFLLRWTKVPDWEIKKQVNQFQIQDLVDKEVLSLSGGFRMRVKILSMILLNPNLILLDEPTNYLDLSTILLLENWIKSFKGTILLITHDREFIRQVSTAIMEVEQGQIKTFEGDLDTYLSKKELEREHNLKVNQNIDKKQAQLQSFVDRFGAKASKAKQAKSKEKNIERLEQEKSKVYVSNTKVRMFIPKVFTKNGLALRVENLAIGYKNKVISDEINLDINRGEKIAVLGDNGQGKSTLLKTLAGYLEVLDGKFKWTDSLNVGYFGQHIEQELPYEVNIYDYFRQKIAFEITDEQVKSTLGSFLFKKEDWTKLIGVLSGGEKSRLNLASVFLGSYDVLILDEPTNHLDVDTVEIMARSLQEFNGTVIFVSHDRTFVNILANVIWEVRDGKFSKYPGKYNEYLYNLDQRLNIDHSEKVKEQNIEVKNVSKNKELQKEIYKVKKELQSIERKISKIKKEDILVNTNASLELMKQEEMWVRVANYLDELQSKI